MVQGFYVQSSLIKCGLSVLCYCQCKWSGGEALPISSSRICTLGKTHTKTFEGIEKWHRF